MESSQGLFADRQDAGRRLACRMSHLREQQPVILALPRGGVPVAFEIARALNAPLDVLLVRKLGAPGFAELGIGAIVEGDPPQRVLHEDLIIRLGVAASYLAMEEQRQAEEIRRRRSQYCGGRTQIDVRDRHVVIVDDGIATGGTVSAALKGVSQKGVAGITLAVPVAPPGVIDSLAAQVNECICLHSPHLFRSVGEFYRDFTQTSDEEVIALLADAALHPDALQQQSDASPGTADRIPND